MTNSGDGDLPGEWRNEKLGAIAEVRLGKMLSAKAREPGLIQKPYLRNENVRWGRIDFSDVKTMGFKASEMDRYAVEPGDLLVCEGGEPGRAAIYLGPPGEFMYQKALHRVRLREGVSTRYVQYFFEHHAARLKTSQTTIAHFPLERMLELTVPLAPLPEQEHIVAEIEKQFTRLDAGVEALRRLQAHLRRYRAAVLAAAFDGTLSPGWRPSAWATKTLADLMGRDGLFADGDWVESKDQDPAGDVRLIQLADVGDGAYRDRSARFLTSAKAAELRTTFLSEGDVLVARMPDPLGRACIFPGDRKEAVTVVDVCILRPDPSGPDRKWLCHAINSPQVRAQVAALQAGTTRKRVSRKNLGTVILRVPRPAEQREIALEVDARLSQVEATTAQVTSALGRASRLRTAVLQAAFAGCLVPPERPARAPAA